MASKVWEPMMIGDVEIKNRIVRTAHATNFIDQVTGITEDYIAYHERAARGGVGLSVLEIGGVHPSTPATMNIWNDTMIEGWQRLMERVRPLGMKVFQQLWHGGSQSFLMQDGPPWSASPVQPITGGQVPRAMTIAQIDEVVESYATAAKRVMRGGLDGIEVQIGHGYLLHQFLSPLSNIRTDEYGGSLENRMRFPLRVIRAVRDAVGGAMPVGVRCSDDAAFGGFSGEDLAEVLRVIQDEGLAEYVSIATGSYFYFNAILGGMYEPSGYQLTTSAPVAETVKVPTLVIGRITTIDEAEAILEAGYADFVGMTRAHIADPLLVIKTREGHASEVRPCIACDACLAGSYKGRLLCTVNPAIGRDRYVGDDLIDHVAQPGHIVVVGGGPGGLEAARAAAMRGHRVTVIEREDALGGQLRMSRRAPNRERTGVFSDWQISEVTRLGVEVITGVTADADFIRSLKPDAVIVATGSRPRLDGVQWGMPSRPLVLKRGAKLVSSWDVLGSDSPSTAATAAVIDDTGHYEAIAVAERLVNDGVDVTYITRHSAFGTLMEENFEVGPALERLRSAPGKFSLVTRALAAVARPGEVECTWFDGGGTPFTVPADLVVFVSANEPQDALLTGDGLEGIPVIGVGDALSPRYLRKAIMEGNDAGRAVVDNAAPSLDEPSRVDHAAIPLEVVAG